MARKDIAKEDILGIEPKHITYVKAQDGSNHDALVSKVVIHTKDGRKIPDIHLKVDYKRPFWVTHKGLQNHRDKKDYELIKNLQRFSSTQIELTNNIQKALGDFSQGGYASLRKLARSPYLYGADISSVALRKHDYRKTFGDLISFNKVAGGDIETNVFTKEQEIICMSVTHKENVSLAYLKSWVSDVADPIGETKELAEKYIGDMLKERNVKLDVTIHDTPAQLVQYLIAKLHEWQPDFFTFWNIGFDMPKIIKALENEGIDPAKVFSDPRVPDNFKYFEYREGPTQKVTASGKTMSINIEDRWNWVTHPASFQCIDSMPVYRMLRLTDGKEPSYALDAILTKELKITKLKFKEVEHLSGLAWHEAMQKHHKIKYGVYNIYDSMLLEMLDEKTNDLSSKISMTAKNSDYRNFNSNPKRLCDDMHFWFLNRDEPAVIGTSSDQPVDELDQHVIGHDSWIVTLPSYMAAPNGLTCVKEFPDYRTLIFAHVADLDVVSTYPNVSQLLNISRETCVMEFSKMAGITEHHRREVGVNLTGGRTNSVEICEKILGAPTLDRLLARFVNDPNYRGIPFTQHQLPEQVIGAFEADEYEVSDVEDADA